VASYGHVVEAQSRGRVSLRVRDPRAPVLGLAGGLGLEHSRRAALEVHGHLLILHLDLADLVQPDRVDRLRA
jgi:hypothetical protein